jgi:hypothetical protein
MSSCECKYEDAMMQWCDDAMMRWCNDAMMQIDRKSSYYRLSKMWSVYYFLKISIIININNNKYQ